MPLYFRLRRKLAASEALHSILNNRGKRFVANDNLSPIFTFDELIADRNEEWIEAALNAGFHLLHCLALVLYALKLALRGDDCLNELSFRRVLEFEVKAFARRAVLRQFRAQADMKFRIPCEALEIVKDNDVVCFAVIAQILKQRHHAGPLHEIAPGSLHVAENFLDCVAARSSIFAAAMLLAAASIAIQFLRGA